MFSNKNRNSRLSAFVPVIAILLTPGNVFSGA